MTVRKLTTETGKKLAKVFAHAADETGRYSEVALWDHAGGEVGQILRACIDEAVAAERAATLKEVWKKIGEARDEEVQKYFDALGEVAAMEDRECRGLSSGFAQAALIVHRLEQQPRASLPEGKGTE